MKYEMEAQPLPSLLWAVNLRSDFILSVEDVRNSLLLLGAGSVMWLHIKRGPLWWKSLVDVIPDGFLCGLYDSRAHQVPNPDDNTITSMTMKAVLHSHILTCSVGLCLSRMCMMSSHGVFTLCSCHRVMLLNNSTPNISIYHMLDFFIHIMHVFIYSHLWMRSTRT